MAEPQEGRRSLLAWTVRLGLGLAILAWVLHQVDLSELREVLVHCRPVPLVDALLLFFSGAVTGSLAWMLLLLPLGYRLSLFQALRLSLVGFFLNNLVPSGLGGDVYRVFALGGMGVPRVHAAASVVVERWSALLALLAATALSFALALPLLRGVTAGPALGEVWEPLGRLRLDLMMGGLLVVLTLGFLGGTVLALWAARSSAPWLERLSMGTPTGAFLEAVAVYRSHPWHFLGAAAINLWSPLLEGLAFSSIADALGLNLSPLLFLAFTPMFRVLNHLPISVNAVGTQEVASIVFWNPLGATREEALAISFLIHALKVLVSTLGAPLYFLGGTYRVEHLDRDGVSPGEARV